jgi:diguanylate cyclase (GGDEF)-like protein
MADDTKAVIRIALIVAIGLAPSLIGLVLTPSRGLAIGAAGTAGMAIVFVLWTQRLVTEALECRRRESDMRDELFGLEETTQLQSRELREARTQDPGTGVLNRTAFLRQLDEAIARDARLGKQLALLLIDIEGFKALNLERGRMEGDAILKRTARALVGATRGTDRVGRLGGDEFAVVLTECDNPGPAVDRIVSSLKARAGDEAGWDVPVAIGAVTIVDPAQGVDFSELFRIADEALGSVRGQGRSACAPRTMCPVPQRQPASA